MDGTDKIIDAINKKRTALGIEFGSTRIKAVLLADHVQVASGSFTWENKYKNNLWTYEMKDAIKGLQESYKSLSDDVKEKYGVRLTDIGAIGISGMMHGYLPLDKNGTQLATFRTWRNTNTERASKKLSELMNFTIPLRWSISQLYQSILDNEEHVKDIAYMTTLAGYIHTLLSGEKVMGVGEASGMFPIDSEINDFDEIMINRFDALITDKEYSWKIKDILPKVLSAGENAGYLTEDGALLIDPKGDLKSGIPMAPPEGDAGTGMTATNAVAARTGNVSAGTSIFAMVVLENRLSKPYPEIDMVTTPSGKPVAMVHCNNCASDFDAWAEVFRELLEAAGCTKDKSELFPILYNESLKGDPDCGKVLVYNYISGEPMVGLVEGRTLVTRSMNAKFNLPNFLRAEIYAALAALRIGMRILENENVVIDRLMGHGGLFKTQGVAQKYLAAACETDVSVMSNAGEGGPYGMALLADFMINKKEDETLESFLEDKIFSNVKKSTLSPEQEDIEGFKKYLMMFEKGLAVEKAAVQSI